MTFRAARAAIEEVEPGAPRPGDVLVQVRAAGIGYGASALMIGCGAADVEAARPFGEIVWLGNVKINQEVAFRCGALMG